MSTSPPSETPSPFITEDLPFAAYLHASRKLRFLTCQVNGIGRIAFVFADANQEGNRLHLEFESGAECGAVTLYDSIRHLRRVMDRTRSNGTHEHHTHPR